MIEALVILGPISLVAACAAAFRYFFRYKAVPEPKPRRSGVTLLAVVIGAAVFSWPIAAFVGVAAACSLPAAGNMCGLLGAIGFAPIVSAAAIFGIAHRWSTHDETAT